MVHSPGHQIPWKKKSYDDAIRKTEHVYFLKKSVKLMSLCSARRKSETTVSLAQAKLLLIKKLNYSLLSYSTTLVSPYSRLTF